MGQIYTREQYMADSREAGPAAHRKYFGQFVTPGTKSAVLAGIGRTKLLASTDPHLNDIPLHLWDRLVPHCLGSAGFVKAGDYYTQANGVCLLKEAARQIIEEYNSRTGSAVDPARTGERHDSNH